MDMGNLSKLAQEQLDAEHKVVLAEIDLKEAKASLRSISEITIPEAMEELELDTVTTKGGLTIDVTAKVHANITKANLPEALAWLREHEHGKLIKGSLVVIPKDQKQSAMLQKRLEKFEVESKEGVHASTLKAWVREMLENGHDFPEELFGYHRQHVSKITVRK